MNFKRNVIPRGTDSAKVIRVVETISIKGSGTEKDPVRYIYQYWDFKGNLLASKDVYEINSSASSEVKS